MTSAFKTHTNLYLLGKTCFVCLLYYKGLNLQTWAYWSKPALSSATHRSHAITCRML